MKEAFRGYIERLKNNCSVKTYALWWVFRCGMIAMAIYSLFDQRGMGETVTAEILMNMACMFIWEICMAMPKKNVFRYIQPFMQTLLTIYIFIAVVAGFLLDFYYKVRLWDSFLHFMCAVFGVFFGYEITCALFKMEKRTASKTMTVIASLGFCLMVTTFWEIFEFGCDQVVGMMSGTPNDVQHWSYELVESTGSPKIKTIFEPYDLGRWPIMDTMGDMVLNAAGAALGTVLLAIYPYRHKGKYKFDFKKIVEEGL